MYTSEQMQALDPRQIKRRRYGQLGDFGYQPSRQSLGADEYTPQRQAQAAQTSGYGAATAGRLFGGRPVGATDGTARQTQMQTLGRPGWSARAMALQPWGGTPAVRRRPRYPQNVGGW